jgi:hypothetical protein
MNINEMLKIRRCGWRLGAERDKIWSGGRGQEGGVSVLEGDGYGGDSALLADVECGKGRPFLLGMCGAVRSGMTDFYYEGMEDDCEEGDDKL